MASIEAAQSASEYDEPWRASRAAEMADEFEFNVTDSERRAAADPGYLRPYGGGEAYDRAMALQALSLYVMADEHPWAAEAIAAFLPIAKAERGGKDDDPSLDNHIELTVKNAAFGGRGGSVSVKRCVARGWERHGRWRGPP